uniref:NADH:ubiquinone reductase (H(+)-translocating) n=1 Tax=Atta laevigata TaxID=493208 RepID=V9MHB6_9HYME|nr:NADH dehydrogenase subunit 5 [Atta laevigata]
MLNMLFFMYMFWTFIMSWLVGVSFYYLDLMVMLEWMGFSFNSMNLKFIMLMDWISILFISFIMLISSMIMLYSMTYMKMEKFMNRFNYLLLLFILSMVMMVISPNMISILLGWDGLGMVSYCLVIYYHNYMSYNSGMVTVLCNRIGDVGILMAISMMMMVGGWDLVMFQGGMELMLLMMLAAVTKSAQIPFSVWLPMAMAAPTPVSALVHSSTLVTAGVYLMIRFNSFLMDSGVSLFLGFISVITMFMSGIMANFENDFKKIIALSTLSQLGLMMMILSYGFKMMAYYHLLIHAIFKSMLFMAAGAVIHLMKNTQDIRLLGNLNEVIPYVMMSLLISNLALSGMPFMSGFYSKDLIMEVIYSSSSLNMMMLVLMVMSLSLTVSYSLRFLYYLFFNSSFKFYSYVYMKEDWVINISMVIMMLLSVVVGSMVNWIFYFDYYMIYLTLLEKMITLLSCLIGILVMILVMMVSKVIKLYYYMYFFSSMWFLISLYSVVYKPINVYSVWMSSMDKSWVEFMSKIFIVSFVKKKFDSIYYKLYMFMFIFVYFMVIMFMFI